MLIGKSDAKHASNMLVEKQKRTQDFKYLSEAYLIDKELPKMYDAVFEPGEMNGVSGFSSHFQMFMVWTMILLSHILIARASQLTRFCLSIDNVEFGPVGDKSGIPSYVYITIHRWKGNENGKRRAPRKFYIKRNLNISKFCLVYNLARWLVFLAENGVDQGPLFPDIEVGGGGGVKVPLEYMTPSRWEGWLVKVF